MKNIFSARYMKSFLKAKDGTINTEKLQQINQQFKKEIPRFVEYNPNIYSFATLIIKCASCGEPIEIIFNEFKKNRSQRVFCNNACRAEGIKGKNHPRYNPATRRVYESNNVVWVKCPEHPFADSRGGIYEHRFIMENHLREHYSNSDFLITIEGHEGKFLSPKIDVHHRNNNGLDNRLENLIPLEHSNHTRISQPFYYQNGKTPADYKK